jgi:sigma-B regulation protein RsbQ
LRNFSARVAETPFAESTPQLKRGVQRREPSPIGLQMAARERNNVTVSGDGESTIVFAHGFGCDQGMWRFLAPKFAEKYRTVLFDLVGSGNSDLTAYDRNKYDTLEGHADDVLEILEQHAAGPVIFVGHSVSATIGLLADIKRPNRLAAHVMVSPSPCYIDDDDYKGGFTRADIDGLLATLESNYLGWSSTMAPAIMGADKPALGQELTNSFCRTDPEIAKHFARVTFLSDARSLLPNSKVPTLILQCTDDLIAPVSVGRYMAEKMPNASMVLIDNVGHCPHMSAPSQSTNAIADFLTARNL